ncbi:TetR/AcrR family transcriptional regulator [uncultured Amnibacterium sp.]|uniref:TetR/AcrR family transcriptional regulator n=1 Tax=uncultured Amnibacterium sp. TaxID=1631851 RepID=UPI0035CAEAEA
MSDRGPYAKGRERRQAILDSTLEVFSTLGSRGASMSAIARHVGVSPALLQYYFSTREDLLQEVITAWDRDNAERSEGLTHFADWLRGVRHNMQHPGLIHLYMTAVVEATDADHPNREFYARRYEGLTPEIAQEIRNQQASGNVDPALDPERIARILLAAIEGLQIRWLHQPDFDMVEEFLFTLERFGIHPPELLTGELDAIFERAAEAARP